MYQEAKRWQGVHPRLREEVVKQGEVIVGVGTKEKRPATGSGSLYLFGLLVHFLWFNINAQKTSALNFSVCLSIE